MPERRSPRLLPPERRTLFVADTRLMSPSAHCTAPGVSSNGVRADPNPAPERSLRRQSRGGPGTPGRARDRRRGAGGLALQALLVALGVGSILAESVTVFT